MLRIGLTGGIGCGKSTVCQLFAALGVPIIDADIIARQLVAPGQSALKQLVATFGPTILNADGSLRRAELRQLAFSNKENKQQLDAIMHPLIYAEIETQAGHSQAPYGILAIPLLLEAQKKYTVDRVLVVDCPPSLQRQRVMVRDHVNEAQVEAIIATQATRQQRLAVANDIIDNSVSADHLAEQVKRLHNSYILLASARMTSA